MSVYLPDSCLYLNLDTSTQVALRLHDAYSTAGCLEHTSGAEPAYTCTHTHTQTQGAVTFLSHNHGNGLRWSEDRCPELYKFSWRTEQRSTFLLPPPSYLHTCWTALTQLPAPNLVFPQRWHMYQAEQEMSWAGREQFSDRCHLQSAQACFWCVNYSINHHITLSGCQHLITYETLPVNGLKYVCVCVWQVTYHVTVNHLMIHIEYM